MQQDVDEAVPFRFETEPVAAAEWREIYAAAAALAAKRELLLPNTVAYFEFKVPLSGGALTCAGIGRQVDSIWQSYMFVEMTVWQLVPIYMVHFPERMHPPRMPSALVWLEDGRNAWTDANAYLARRDAGQQPSLAQFAAHLAVQAGELLLYLAVATRGQNDAWRVLRRSQETIQ